MVSFEEVVSDWMGFVERVKHGEVFDDRVSTDHTGAKTLGYGCNLDRGISESVAHAILNEQLRECRDAVLDTKRASHLNEARIQVLAYLWYMLGREEMLSLKDLWNAIEEGQYHTAADEILNTRVFTQTPQRCKTLANTMRAGS